VVFWDAEPPRRPDSHHPESAAALSQRFLHALERHQFTSLGESASGKLTISGGLATFPWDGQSCKELLRHANVGLREVKTSGKNSIYLIGAPEEKSL
jgi:GGDEF domain-containing protein